MTAARIYAAGKVRRWHANPALAHIAQTNADHVGGCIRLLLMLYQSAPYRLILAVAHHDDGERWVGDMPYDFKQAAPELAEQHARAEARALHGVLGFDVFETLTPNDHKWLKLVDRLEAYAHVAMYRPEELARNGWPQARVRLLEMADDIGGGFPYLRERVARFIADMEAAAW